MIVILATVKFGAMPQFAIQIYNSMLSLGEEAALFIPESAKITLGSIEKNQNIFKYDLPDNFSGKKLMAKKISVQIHELHPTCVWVADESTTSLLIMKNLKNNTRVKFIIHDVSPHIYEFSYKKIVRNIYFSFLRKRIFGIIDQLILLSMSSRKMFLGRYPKYENKTTVLRLGAAIPDVQASRPQELNLEEDEKYYLFFGAIEKYKNVIGLLRAYSNIKNEGRHKLVIAGKGKLDETELGIIKQNENDIIFINRFIEDSEMIYLFEHAVAIVLPYIEASQSGVLALGYFFSLPAIVTDLPGLTEYVEDNNTGFICKDESEISKAMEKMLDENVAGSMGLAAKDYYGKYLDFGKNVKGLIN